MALIGILGKAGTGKDTMSDFLVDVYDFVPLAFADPLKQLLISFLGLTHSQVYDQRLKYVKIKRYNKTPRELLQLIGTDMFRNQIQEDFWVLKLQSKLEPLLKDRTNVVVSDVRFHNELELIERLGGTTVLVKGRDRVQKDSSVKPFMRHSSEVALDNVTLNYNIYNDSTVNNFYEKIDDFMYESNLNKP